jgi:hypothetical protein
LVMANFMLNLHQTSVNMQNGTCYDVFARGRLVLMANCKTLPTSPHHLKLHNSSIFKNLLSPPIGSISPPFNISFQTLLGIKCQQLFLLNILLLGCYFFSCHFYSNATT